MLALIERYSKSSFYWPNLVKQKKIPNLSVEQILQQYQGFEGELIAYFPKISDEKELEESISKCLKIKDGNPLFVMLLINSNLDTEFPIDQKKFFIMGYDVGIFGEQIYSSIFNEIIFGYFEKLIEYKKFLNEHYLFFDHSLTSKYLELHNKMSEQGKGVEDYQKMNIYQIWKYEN